MWSILGLDADGEYNNNNLSCLNLRKKINDLRYCNSTNLKISNFQVVANYPKLLK